MSRNLYIHVLRCMNIPVYFYLQSILTATLASADSPRIILNVPIVYNIILIVREIIVVVREIEYV